MEVVCKVIPLKEKRMERETLAGRLDKALAELPVIEQHIIVKRFSLDGTDAETVTQIANTLNTSKDVVDEIVDDVLRKLRRSGGLAAERQIAVA